MSEVVFKWSERRTGYRFDGFDGSDVGEQRRVATELDEVMEPRRQDEEMFLVQRRKFQWFVRAYRSVAYIQGRVTLNGEDQEEMTTKGAGRDDNVVLDIRHALFSFAENSKEDVAGLGVFDIRRRLFPSAVAAFIGQGRSLQLFKGLGRDMTVEVVQDFWTEIGGCSCKYVLTEDREVHKIIPFYKEIRGRVLALSRMTRRWI